MTKYIAFLRAINVGGHTVKMDRLRGLFESLGVLNVETFIASGNVIFEAKKKDDYVYVAFLHEPLSPQKKSVLMAVKNKFNDFAQIRREIYWLRLNKDDSIFLKSSLEKILKVSTTVRNITTVRKIVEAVDKQGKAVL